MENDNNNKAHNKFSGKPQHTCTRLIKKFSHWLLNQSKNPLQFVLNLSVFWTYPIVYWKVQSWLFSATTSLTNLYSFILNQQPNTVLCFFAFTANWIYPDKWQFLVPSGGKTPFARYHVKLSKIQGKCSTPLHSQQSTLLNQALGSVFGCAKNQMLMEGNLCPIKEAESGRDFFLHVIHQISHYDIAI